jgi:hypothetical protein
MTAVIGVTLFMYVCNAAPCTPASAVSKQTQDVGTLGTCQTMKYLFLARHAAALNRLSLDNLPVSANCQ